MKKINLLTALFVTLLVCGNLWAGNTCKIGTQEYASLVDAIAAVPANDVPTTIQMIADENAGEVGASYADIANFKNVVLDLNGHKLTGFTSNTTGNTFLIQVGRRAALTIMDSQAPNDPKLGNGKISFSHNAFAAQKWSTGNSTIVNRGTLVVKSGIIALETDPQYEDLADYTIDNYLNSQNTDVICTVEGGYIYSTLECFRNNPGSTTGSAILNLLGGEYYGGSGLIFIMGASNCKSTTNISGGNFECGDTDKPLIRVYTDGKTGSQLAKCDINISGGEANVDALKLQYNVYYSGDASQDAKDVEKCMHEFEELYSNIFNITGGTFKSDEYSVSTNILEGKQPDGSTSWQVKENTSYNDHTLPTLLDGAAFKVDSLDVNKYEIVPVVNNNITDASQLNDPDEAATIAQNIVIGDGTTAVKDSAYNITVKDNSTLTIKANAELFVGAGGITIEEGSKVIVEAGAILKVGANGVVGTGADALVVYSNMEASGVVAISPMAYLNQSPQLSIRMQSAAYCENSEDWYWQFFAIPTKTACNLDWNEQQVPAVWMKKYNVSTGAWEYLTSTSELNTPFVGYCLATNVASRGAANFTMNGALVGRDDAVLTLKGNSSKEGWNLFGNSYLAPINVEKMLADIKVSSDVIGRYVYIYNSQDGNYKFNNGETKEFTSIPPMNAFFMCNTSEEDAAFTINYAKTVWGNDDTNPMLAPSRGNSQIMKIHVQSGKYEDDMYLKNANTPNSNVRKMMNDKLNLYVSNDDVKYAFLAKEDLNGTQISLAACAGVEYTLSFENAEGYTLIDKVANKSIVMTEGATYTFAATPNSTDANRFEIRKISDVITNVEEVSIAPSIKGIYTIMGQYVAETDMFDALPAGVYVVDGVKIVK